MVGSNFTECGARYLNSPELISRWNYTGPTKLIPNNPQSQITFEGCTALCGTAPDWYDWSTSSSTITTWVLPIIGTLLQAPFESNAFWRTVKASCRWIGSPMSSLAAILWNIEVSGKCALFVDMAVPYGGPIPDQHSDFASMRDSFYILMNLNQYRMKPLISMTKEAEGLLRIVLFSRDLNLIGTKKTLRQMREKLAAELRSNRRKGVVPVFISTLWFLFALGISIQSAFGYLGSNSQAHDLAMGLFVSWFPVLVLSSIVDRNPVASDDIRRKLNKLVDITCDSLQDHENRERFIASFATEPEAQRMAYWVRKISHQAAYIKGDYFSGFAGQARTRFHYGAAHAILIDIEKAYIADHGRNWLADEHEARIHLILGHTERGLVWFDGRQMWQFFSAVLIVVGTGAGAFILSYFTPTVGLGCRSGGFMIFGVVAFALLLSELFIWIYTSPIRNQQVNAVVQQHISASSHFDLPTGGLTLPGFATTEPIMGRLVNTLEAVVLAAVLTLARILTIAQPNRKTRLLNIGNAVRKHFAMLRTLTSRQWLELCILQPGETVNAIWLCYLIIMQTFGGFVTCACQTSGWAAGGGYLDFTQWDYTNAPMVQKYWITGTSISCVVMSIGMIYICIEWCLQAHLSTENYFDAMQGLQNVRRFRRCTFWVRYPASVAVLLVNRLARFLGMRKSHERKTLVWTKDSKYTPSIRRTILTLGTRIHNLSFAESQTENGKTNIGQRVVDDPQLEHPRPTLSRAAHLHMASVTAQPLSPVADASTPQSGSSLEALHDLASSEKMV